MKTIEQELAAIRGNNPLLLPERVVDWAQSHPKSALYAEFTWDDSEAAREYRLWQARRVIALHVVTEAGERKTISLTVDRSKGGGYRDVEDVVRQPDLREIMLRDALTDLRRVHAKYQQLTELARVFAEIEKVDQKHGGGKSGKAA